MRKPSLDTLIRSRRHWGVALEQVAKSRGVNQYALLVTLEAQARATQPSEPELPTP